MLQTDMQELQREQVLFFVTLDRDSQMRLRELQMHHWMQYQW